MPGDARPGAAPLASMVADLPCAVCGVQSAHVELVAPGELPAGWADWDSRRQESYHRHHDPGRWRFSYDGPAAGSGDGHDIDIGGGADHRGVHSSAPRCPRHDDAGFHDSAGLCDRCDVPYCREHWHVTASGTGTCPQGHTKSLDPHWSPDDW